ncbi:TetR/AcrR family transcriptional regulator [Microbacterium halophytorum]|uniref:TetR/AcrR family transcriptional regulator n=1 Tax=Microbacterium halophytorum TaxID=2067568 RepID=UPI000CFC8E83|nr:TetR/AcrR family transcriptional regulator [Microbacterium halophytorum]
MTTSAQRPRIRDAERTRRELLDVAAEVFAEHGYSGARVDEIADRTRTTKRMIYYYFGGKEQLYSAVLERAYRGIREEESRIDVAGLDPLEALREIATATFDHHVGDPEFIRLVMIENVHGAHFLKRIDSLRELGQPAVDLLDVILRRGREMGEIREGFDALDVHMLISAYCVFQVANQHTFGHLFGRDPLAPESLERTRAMLPDIVEAWVSAR